jgi:hypothetical protein
MNDDARPEERDPGDDSSADDFAWADDQLAWADAPSAAETVASFCDQMQRGVWPIRVPMALEIYAEGARPQVQPRNCESCEGGLRRRCATNRVSENVAGIRCMPWHAKSWVREMGEGYGSRREPTTMVSQAYALCRRRRR